MAKLTFCNYTQKKVLSYVLNVHILCVLWKQFFDGVLSTEIYCALWKHVFNDVKSLYSNSVLPHLKIVDDDHSCAE